MMNLNYLDKIDLLYDLMHTLNITIDKEINEDFDDDLYCQVNMESFDFDNDKNLLTIELEYEGNVFSKIAHVINKMFLVRSRKVYRIDNGEIYCNFVKLCNISIRWHNIGHDDPDYII